MTKKERLEAIMAHYAEGKTSLMAAKLGVADSTISSWLARNTFDIELLFAKCENISAEWLLTGEGDMIISKSLIDVTELYKKIARLERENNMLYDQIALLKGDIVVPHHSVETA